MCKVSKNMHFWYPCNIKNNEKFNVHVPRVAHAGPNFTMFLFWTSKMKCFGFSLNKDSWIECWVRKCSKCRVKTNEGELSFLYLFYGIRKKPSHAKHGCSLVLGFIFKIIKSVARRVFRTNIKEARNNALFTKNSKTQKQAHFSIFKK